MKVKTKLQKIDRSSWRAEELEEAVRLLRAGELVAFPTETVYGLGGNALDATAAARIYAAKGRPSDNPLIVHIAEIGALEQLAEAVPEAAYRLATAFWPGPLTLIVKKSKRVPDSTTGGLQTVAIRMPSDEIAAALIRESGLFIAAPSANASGRPSTTTAAHVYEDLNGRIPLILDGGAVPLGLESTILDLSGETPTLLRPGFITQKQLAAVLGAVDCDKGIASHTATEPTVAKAPGMKYKHYAPRGSMTIYEGEQEPVLREICARAREAAAAGLRTGILAAEETAERYRAVLPDEVCVMTLGARTQGEALAAGLFACLRAFDTRGIDCIFAESFSENELGEAIMNRLRKAAAYRIVSVS